MTGLIEYTVFEKSLRYARKAVGRGPVGLLKRQWWAIREDFRDGVTSKWLARSAGSYVAGQAAAVVHRSQQPGAGLALCSRPAA